MRRTRVRISIAGGLQGAEFTGVFKAFGRQSGRGAFEQAPQFDGVINVFGRKSLNHKSASRTDLEKALVSQTLECQVQRNAGDLKFGGQRDFPNAFAGAKASLHQHLAKREDGSRRL